jgi:YfiH family protein
VSAYALRAELPGSGHALFTARVDGNMSSVAGEGAKDGQLARERLRAEIGVPRLVRGYQVHGSVVRSLSELPEEDEDEGRPRVRADGQATGLAGVGAMVLTADCLPVALGRSGAVAMLHAGWRGLAAGVLESGVAALRGCGGDEAIVAVIGPGAGVCCYEVGADVHAALGSDRRVAAPIDLRAIARERLLAAGVAEVGDLAACTICDERFFSHRREGTRAGRQAAVAWRS